VGQPVSNPDRDAWLAKYQNDPVAFVREVLGASLTAKQEQILRALVEPPHRVLVKSANNIGKSWLAGAACVWFYMTNDPALIILTAPIERQVNDITFKEIRRLYGNRPGIYPKSPRIEDHIGHLMTGFTASDATSFQGMHEEAMLVVFEECVGVDQEFWDAARGVLSGGICRWLAICNPTDSSSHAYTEEISGGWTVINVSAFEHPNIEAELRGADPPIPAAVRIAQLAENMDDWGDWIEEGEEQPTDVDLGDPATYGLADFTAAHLHGITTGFPARFWRPGPVGEARVLGRYPAQSAYSIFSDAAFELAARKQIDKQTREVPVIGCDVARFGDDATCIHVRQGDQSLEHRTYRKHSTTQTANVLKQLAREYAAAVNVRPYEIPVLIDDDGVGGGVTDQRYSEPTDEDRRSQDPLRTQGVTFQFIPIRSGSTAHEEDKYPNVRSELLFALAERMAMGRLCLAPIPTEQQQELRRQAIGITYRLDPVGRRVAEPKHGIKARLGRSPDDLDAMALAYYPIATEKVKFERVIPHAYPIRDQHHNATPFFRTEEQQAARGVDSVAAVFSKRQPENGAARWRFR
jgi:hypothetical protein